MSSLTTYELWQLTFFKSSGEQVVIHCDTDLSAKRKAGMHKVLQPSRPNDYIL